MLVGQCPCVLYLVHKVELAGMTSISPTLFRPTVSELVTRAYKLLRCSDQFSARWVRQADAVFTEAGWGMYCSTSFRTSSNTAAKKERYCAYKHFLPSRFVHGTKIS